MNFTFFNVIAVTVIILAIVWVYRFFTTEIQRDFRDFCQQWDRWQADGAKGHRLFSREHGLCRAWEDWYMSVHGCETKTRYRAGRFIEKKFAADGLHTIFPFNHLAEDGKEYIYGLERGYSEMHLNPKRLAWVKMQAR